MRVRIFLATVFVSLLSTVPSVHAQVYGGNNASDYQPPTRNPQSGVATGIQTNNTNIQPTDIQRGVNQQSLAPVPNLQVTTTTDRGAASTAPEPAKKPSRFRQYFLLNLALFTTVVIAVWVWKQRRKPKATEDATERPIIISAPAPVIVKKSKKKKANQPNHRKKSRKK